MNFIKSFFDITKLPMRIFTIALIFSSIFIFFPPVILKKLYLDGFSEYAKYIGLIFTFSTVLIIINLTIWIINKNKNNFIWVINWYASLHLKLFFKVSFIKLLNKVIDWLQSIHYKFSTTPLNSNAYSSLSPTDNCDEDGKYYEALLWALKNRQKEDIKNIALTGPYGSGKSSILKTFQKNYKDCDLKFLNISLATFKEEKKVNNLVHEEEIDEGTIGEKIGGKNINTKDGNTAELLRLIEISILEQIFYHEKDSKIPDSRFKKIKSFNKTTLFFTTIGYLLFIVAIYNYYNPFFIQSILKDFPINNNVCDTIHYSSFIIIAIGTYFIIRKSIRLISAITISKLNIQNAEISIGNDLNKSILNHHIDELLYFFSVRPYNVVIIEDLDRFEETEIFTKLRELNLLLNNSKKTKKKDIVFIYAVRDNMFTDKERTKFFDFIIPVIPIINSSNSSDILLRKRNEFNLDLSDAFIEDIAFFIDDMRLLHNITNEFHLYSKKLDSKLIHNKLFGIITYKNMYPNDFMRLSKNEGELYNIFLLKSKHIKEFIDNTDTEISKIKEQIKALEKVYFDNKTDLRKLYLAQIISNLTGFSSFIINNNSVDFNDATSDENFEYIKSNNFSFNQSKWDIYNNREIIQVNTPNFKFFEIEKSVHNSKIYSVREKEITEISNGKINILKHKIQELEQHKQNARNLKLGELLTSNKLTEIEISKNLNKDFVLILLRNGYIDEDYTDYISLFHEESIMRSDYQFLINIKNKNKQRFDYSLSKKIKKLIPKINPFDFQTEYILNYDLMNYLLQNSGSYKTQIDSVFIKLKDESKESIDFIKGYYGITTNLESFVKILCNKWSNVWGFVSSSEDYSDDFRTHIFKSILEFAEVDAIKKIALQSSLKSKILSDSLFLNSISDTNKLKDIIEQLDLKFSNIDFENSNIGMLDYIYENNLYDFDIQTITSIIKKFGKFNQINFDNSNFYAIQTSEALKLIQYIDLNFEEYIENIYLKIPTNCNEKLDSYIELLNHPTLKIRNKELIISQVNTKIDKLSKIEDKKLCEILLVNNKMLATWENLLFAYNSEELVEGEEEKEILTFIIDFINIFENAEALATTKIPKETEEYKVFWKKILESNEIENVSYNLITKSSPWWYSTLKFEKLSQDKIISLINNTCITPIKESYDKLKEFFGGLNIALFEKRKTDYFKILNELTFDSNDLYLVLNSKILENSEKLKIIDICTEDTITTNSNLQLIASILIQDASFLVQEDIIQSIITNGSVPTDKRIKIFIKYSSKYDNNFVDSFLKSLGGDYAEITNTSLKAKLLKTEEHRKLLDIISNKNYISSYSVKEKYYMVNHKRK